MLEKTVLIDTQNIKVTIHIPEVVKDLQEKINRIYDILNPSDESGVVYG